MEKVYYKNQDEFLSAIKPYKTIDCIEGTIYITENFVYKILNGINCFCSSKLLNSLGKLDKNLITVPEALIYFFIKYKHYNKCVGFVMENGGEDLWSLLLNDVLSFDEKKNIALQMKEICVYLRKKGYVHGDIKLENFLYKDGNLRLADINNMRKNINIKRSANSLRMPPLYKNWYLKCEDGFYVDYIAINYCMYILLNFDLEGIIKIISTYSYGFHYDFDSVLDSENKTFDDTIYEKMKDTFEHIEERKLAKEFLVDYLI